MPAELRELYPEIEPYATGTLRVSNLHTIYFELCGNPDGLPVIVLHGGPGAGSYPQLRRFFDPKVYRIVLLDQRGAGKSTPVAELRENTTQDLVSDIEKLRGHLGITKWLVFGGSWGSTLALAYAISHTSVVLGLVLRGICFGSKEEVAWGYEAGMLSRFYPEYWDEYVAPVPEAARGHIVYAYNWLLSSGSPETQLDAARRWAKWQMVASELWVDPDETAKELADGSRILQWARIENHYLFNHCFMEDGYLLEGARRCLGNVPTVIVQGRYDMVCPIQTAHRLKSVLPNAEYFVTTAGHAAGDEENVHRLVEATDRFDKGFFRGV